MVARNATAQAGWLFSRHAVNELKASGTPFRSCRHCTLWPRLPISQIPEGLDNCDPAVPNVEIKRRKWAWQCACLALCSATVQSYRSCTSTRFKSGRSACSLPSVSLDLRILVKISFYPVLSWELENMLLSLLFLSCESGQRPRSPNPHGCS